MKVLNVIPVIAPRYGGPSSVIFPLCRALRRIPGVDVELATTNADGPGKTIDSSLIPTDFSVHVFPRIISERWQYSKALKDWLESNVSRFDIVHTHALWTYVPGATGLVSRKKNVPYIVRPAGMLSSYTFSKSAWVKRLYWSMLEHDTVRHAAAFHATSDEEAVEIQSYRPDARIKVISNGVDEEAWSMPVDRQLLRDKLDLSPSTPIILFLSRLHPKKGIVDRLLPAFAKLNSEAVLVIGGGEDDRAVGYKDRVHSSAKALGVADRVHVLGAVTFDERWYLYDGADVFVLPSHSENFGIVVAEAMARGCPVVVTEAVQASSHVRAAGAGEIVSGEPALLAAALDRMISDSAKRQACGAAGKAYAAEHFRWDRIAVQVRQMYDECLATR